MSSYFKKVSICFLILIVCKLTSAQQTTRVLQSGETSGKVRALIIGVSSYANLPVHFQLDYADDDALAFKEFLKTRPDIIDKENIITLINEDATDKTLITNTLYSLLNESQKGDLVIIYFSGHGDIQNVLGKDKGFFLLHNVTFDGDYYTGDALRISELQELLTAAASEEKGVKILLITDACHSGKILSSETAKEKVLSSLTTEWGNIYKLVSCQPNESSYESPKWGKGHGVFSYYLIYALKGLADKSGDNQLKFGEIASYIYDKVTEATDWKQNPDSKGPKGNILLNVIEDHKQQALAELNVDTTKKNNSQLTMKGLSDYFAAIPSDLMLPLQNFEETARKGILIPIDTIAYADLPEATEAEIIKKEFVAIYSVNARAVGISNDGKLIAVGGKDSRLKILDNTTQREIMNFDCEGVLSLKFTNDDRYLISGDWYNKTTIWDLKENKKLKEIRNDNDIRVIALNRTGTMAATAGNGNYITIYNTKTWEEIKQLKKHHNGIVRALAFYQNDTKIISGSEDNHLIINNIQDNSVSKKINLGSDVVDFEITLDNNLIFAATASGKVKLFSYNGFLEVHQYYPTINDIEAIEISKYGDYLFVSGKQRQIFIINNKKQKTIAKTLVPRGISDLDFNTETEQLAFAMYGGKLGVFDLKNTKSFTKGYAKEYYDKLSKANMPENMLNRINGFFISQLMKQSKNITTYFINGEGQKPSKNEFIRANTCLDLALDIAGNDKYLKNKILFTKKLLEILESIDNGNNTDLAKAEGKLKQLIEKYPDATFTHNTLSSVFRKQNLLDSAETRATLSAERIPDWTEPKINIAKANAAKGLYNKAIDELNKVIDLQPDKSKGYAHLGDLYSYLGNYQQAEALITKAKKIDKDDAWIHQRQAVLKIRQGQIEEAKQLLNKSLKANPNDYRASFISAKLAHYEYVLSSESRKNSKYSEINNNLLNSLKELTNLLRNYPNCSGVETELADLFYTIDKNKQNYINIEQIEEFIDNNSQILNITVKNYLAISKKYALKALTRNPDDLKAVCVLVKYFSERDDKKELRAAINRLQNSTNQSLAQYFIGKYYYEKGDFKNARIYLGNSLDKDPYFTPSMHIYFATFNGKPEKHKFGEKIKDVFQINNHKKNKSQKNLAEKNQVIQEKVEDLKSSQHEYVQYFFDVFY